MPSGLKQSLEVVPTIYLSQILLALTSLSGDIHPNSPITRFYPGFSLPSAGVVVALHVSGC